MKKTLALVLALVMALCAMSVSVFAEEIVLFDNAEGQQVTVSTDPWDGFGVGVAPVNGSSVGELSIEEVVAYAEAGATLTMVYTSTGCWGADAHPEIEFNVWEPEELTESIAFVNTVNEDGTITGTVNLGDVLANYIEFGGDVASIVDCGIQLWAQDFLLHKLVISTDAPVETPATEEEAPAEDVEEAPATEEAPAEEPAETGLALAVVPMIIAALAVVVSKKR